MQACLCASRFADVLVTLFVLLLQVLLNVLGCRFFFADVLVTLFVLLLQVLLNVLGCRLTY